MSLLHKIRWYHAALVILTLLAYFTGDFGAIHDWLGYAVGVIIVLRLGWAVLNPRQLGLNKFYPHFEGLDWHNALSHPAISKSLILVVAVTVILATVTGLMTLGEGGHVFEDIHRSTFQPRHLGGRRPRRISLSDEATARAVHALSR